MRKQYWEIGKDGETKLQCLENLNDNLSDIFDFLNENFNHKKHIIEFEYGFCIPRCNWVHIIIRNKTKEELVLERL